MRPRAVCCTILSLCLLVLPGCWDMKDVDERAMVMAIGIDLAEDEGEEEGEKPMGAAEEPRYRMSVEVPVLHRLLVAGEAGGAGGEEHEKAAWVLTSTGTSPAAITSKYDTRIWRVPFYGQAQVLVIGEEAARRGLRDLLDYFHRHQDVNNSRLILLIAQGEALDVIEVAPEIEDLLGIYLHKLVALVATTGRVQFKTFAEAIMELYDTGNAVLPRVRPAETETVVGGSAVIKNWRLVGWLGEMETFGSLCARGRLRGGTLVVGSPASETGEVAVSVTSSSTRTRVFLDGDRLRFEMLIRKEVDLTERLGGRLFDAELLQEVEEMLEEEVRNHTSTAIRKLQDEFSVDALGFHHIVRKQLPDAWEQMAENWDDVHFPEAVFQIQTDVNIRRTGTFR